MNLYESVVKFLSNKSTEIEAPEGMCPNCWGKQEYAGRFKEVLEIEHINTNNVLEKKGWIQAHAVKHFEGIKTTARGCPSCTIDYQAK